MCSKIFTVLSLLVVFANILSANNDVEYLDSVINMLLNGDSFEIEESEEDVPEQDVALIGGVWKCGNCADVDESKLVYSEVNDLETEVTEDQPVEMQISLSVPSMSCVAVVGEQPGIVRRVTGSCIGAHVTLSITAVSHFTVNVYTK
ncbi:uncharacterized protein LOC125228193 [Leguminivora glycinivorella]|uniref:uncharacterized protein LOC125228193 n=1 Tax=Leguminivora glycinivorella TaxID=1035111 RepID=UPI00201064B4|nr:uncharacterized protein LOC125228193 [Leguminivora glycinivorella]